MTVQGDVASGFGAVADAFAGCVADDAPGAAFCAVVDGQVVADLWAGTRDERGRPWEADTACLVASGTKGVVATAMAMLLERDLLELDAAVSRYWPEFAAAGKEGVRVADVVAHTAGLPGVVAPLSVEDLRDPPRIEALLAAQEPMVPIGEPTYHALTYGWLCDALVRRVDGRTVGRFVADEIAGPLELDLSIGTPPERAARAAEMRQAANFALAAFLGEGPPDPRLAYVYGNPPVLRLREPEMLALEVPGANCVATARALAGLYGCLARGGELDGVRILAPETVELARRPLSEGHDPLSGRLLRFGVGFELAPNPSELGPEADAFGHTGSGGSSHGAWPARRTGFSFVISEMRPENDDGRAGRVLRALQGALDID
ncbi:MAG TPA: serine hydrolase domain-containing protein [Acidimicrobiales bacterium]|nr:serine hydrolase domain-containing protein [Acidimicrobiales bacterium]